MLAFPLAVFRIVKSGIFYKYAFRTFRSNRQIVLPNRETREYLFNNCMNEFQHIKSYGINVLFHMIFWYSFGDPRPTPRLKQCYIALKFVERFALRLGVVWWG